MHNNKLIFLYSLLKSFMNGGFII